MNILTGDFKISILDDKLLIDIKVKFDVRNRLNQSVVSIERLNTDFDLNFGIDLAIS